MGIITICYSIQKRIEGIDVLSCTFAGHREVYEKDAAAKIECAVHQLIEKDERFCFYTGGMGEFGCMCERTIRRIKKECILLHPFNHYLPLICWFYRNLSATIKVIIISFHHCSTFF